MADENQTPAVTPEPRKVILPQVLITKVDVSKSKVDPALYMKREMLLYQEYPNFDDTSKVFEFFQASYVFRSAFKADDNHRSSFAVYPTGTTLMSSSPDEDLRIDHDTVNNKVTAIYSILFNITLDEWKVLAESKEYKAFTDASAGIVDILGWTIPEYRVATVYSDMNEIEKITYNGAAALWNNSKAV